MKHDDLRLYCITDADPYDWDEIFAWWVAVWAPSAKHALDWAFLNYYGDHRMEEAKDFIRISHTEDQSKYLKPEKDGIHEERRFVALRQAGWREEGESECDSCGLYALGFPEWEVCDACYLCRECREDCEECEDEIS